MKNVHYNYFKFINNYTNNKINIQNYTKILQYTHANAYLIYVFLPHGRKKKSFFF